MANPNTPSLKVGIAGFGSIGRLHARIFDNLGEVATIDIADLQKDPESKDFQSLSKRGAFFGDYRELEDCAIVVIALPTELHEEAVSYFSSKKTAMLIEKPLGLTSDESARIVDRVKQEQVPAMCGLTGLYHPEFRAMYKQLDSIGDLLDVSERLHEANPGLSHLLNGERGVLTLNGIHTLHRFYKIASVKNRDKTLKADNTVLDHRYFRKRAEDDAQGTLYLGSIPFTFSMSYRDGTTCDNGWPIDYVLEVSGTEGKITVTGYEKCETRYNDGRTEVNYRHPKGPLNGRSQYSRIGLGLEREIEEFMRFLGTGQKVHHTLDEALAGQKLVEECYRVASLVK